MALNLKRPSRTQEEQADRPVNGRRSISRSKSQAPAFIRATSEFRNRLIANIAGPEKTGKDHMALLFDGGPIYIHSFDWGLDGVIDKFLEGPRCIYGPREIYKVEYKLEIQPGEATEKEVGESANRLWTDYRSNLLDSYASTRKEGLVLNDTGTEVWELLRLAYFGKLTQVMPHHYAKPNAEFRDIVRAGFDATNVVWLHKMKDEWENFVDSKGQEKGRRTGQKIFVGNKDIPFLVQSNIQTGREDLEGGGSRFYATITDSRLNPTLNGAEIENDFNVLLAMETA